GKITQITVAGVTQAVTNTPTSFTVTGFGELTIDSTGAWSFQADRNIDNKNDFKLPLDNITYSISSGVNKLFTGKLSQQNIGHGKNNIQVPLTIASSALFKNVFSLLKNPNIPLTIAVDSPMFSFSETKVVNFKSLL
ncbi:MAG: LEA type 2 family protein, partial [Psychrobium sp.]|nr:LEA type 2 family protein [Psychrobium sp.]